LAELKSKGNRKLLEIGIENITKPLSQQLDMMVDKSLNNYFQISIKGIGSNKDSSGRSYLPITNISYTMAGLETISLSIGVFSDIPIVTGNKLPKLTLTISDNSDDSIENDLRNWFGQTVLSEKGTVGYLADMVRDLDYSSYSPKGNLNFYRRFQVMLAEDFTTSRDYESNTLKTMDISLIVIGSSIDGSRLF